MTRRSTIWMAGAAVYAVVNFGGAVFAIVAGEPVHAGVHVLLLLVGVAVWSRFGPRRREVSEAPAGASGELTGRFRNLEHSIDAVAIEVDRISESQRAMTDLLVDREVPARAEGSPASRNVPPDRSSS